MSARLKLLHCNVRPRKVTYRWVFNELYISERISFAWPIIFDISHCIIDLYYVQYTTAYSVQTCAVDVGNAHCLQNWLITTSRVHIKCMNSQYIVAVHCSDYIRQTRYIIVFLDWHGVWGSHCSLPQHGIVPGNIDCQQYIASLCISRIHHHQTDCK